MCDFKDELSARLVERKATVVRAQVKEIKATGCITCGCGHNVPLRFMYKCLYCGEYHCKPCAEVHFGQTIKERNKERGFAYYEL
jgi:hypothetical protein